MALNVQTQTPHPTGNCTGTIVSAMEGTRTFNPADGPEPQVIVTIKPDSGADNVQLAEVLYTPVLNGLSALSALLARLGMEPEDGTAWEPKELVGTRVAYRAVRKDNGFVAVVKASIVPAK